MPSATIDEYLAGVPDDKRAALDRLRQLIQSAAPEANEAISYGMPAFKLDGRFFVGFGAAKDHCSFYVGRAPLVALATELAGYRLWKGTINFQPDHALPAELVTKLVEMRVAEYRAG
jgi:uncharacterized protein YdhG (YjbR/CyaY superfamily)